jgi:hypothetical protein
MSFECSKCFNKRAYEHELERLYAKKRGAKDTSTDFDVLGGLSGALALSLSISNWFRFSNIRPDKVLVNGTEVVCENATMEVKNFKALKLTHNASMLMFIVSGFTFIQAYSYRRVAKEYKFQIKQWM